MNIFEPRYVLMLDEALKTERLIGMVRPKSAQEDDTHLYDIGCAGRVTSFNEEGDGRYSIVLTGVSRFHLLNHRLTLGGFERGEVDWNAFAIDLTEDVDEVSGLRERLIERLGDYLDEMGLAADWESLQGASSEAIVNSISMSCPFDAEEKQALLEAPGITERAETLIALMEMAILKTNQEGGERYAHRLQ